MSLIDLIIFDALVGNNDRHFYNWGVLGDIKKRPGQRVQFAPIYDSARALFWKLTEDKIVQMHERVKKDSKELDVYLKRSKPRFSFEGNPDANHFELIEFLVNYNEAYKKRIKALCECEKEKAATISCVQTSTGRIFSVERVELMAEALHRRFSIIREFV